MNREDLGLVELIDLFEESHGEMRWLIARKSPGSYFCSLAEPDKKLGLTHKDDIKNNRVKGAYYGWGRSAEESFRAAWKVLDNKTLNR